MNPTRTPLLFTKGKKIPTANTPKLGPPKTPVSVITICNTTIALIDFFIGNLFGNLNGNFIGSLYST